MSFYRQYFISGILLAFLAISIVIAIIVMVNVFDILLKQVTLGNIDKQYFLPLVTSGFIRYYTFGFGAAACLGGIYHITQMQRNNEITAWKASGISSHELLISIIKAGLLMASISSIFYLWIAPSSERFYAEQYALAQKSAETRIISGKKFSNITDIGQLYVEKYNKDTGEFSNSFLVLDSAFQKLKRITTSNRGNLESNQDKFAINKFDGRIIEITNNKVTGILEFNSLHYTKERDSLEHVQPRQVYQKPTLDLLNSPDEASKMELGKRFGFVFFVFNNTLLLAFLLKTKPRSNQVRLIFSTIFIHLIYRYIIEWQITLPIILEPLIWVLLPHLCFLLCFIILWTIRKEL